MAVEGLGLAQVAAAILLLSLTGRGLYVLSR